MMNHNPLFLLELDGNNTPEELHSVNTISRNEPSAEKTCYSFTNNKVNNNIFFIVCFAFYLAASDILVLS